MTTVSIELRHLRRLHRDITAMPTRQAGGGWPAYIHRDTVIRAIGEAITSAETAPQQSYLYELFDVDRQALLMVGDGPPRIALRQRRSDSWSAPVWPADLP